MNENNLPDKYKPISMWGYFGYRVLFAVPIIGLTVAIVLAINANNINLKNFARSQFCFLIIISALIGTFFIFRLFSQT